MARIEAIRDAQALIALIIGLSATIALTEPAFSAGAPAAAVTCFLPQMVTAPTPRDPIQAARSDALNKAYQAEIVDYRQAAGADQGAIAGLYESGSTPPDLAAAVRWYREAAESGDPSAEDHLGALYEQGKGVGLDPDAALSWYRKAAEQGLPKGEYDLGRLYAGGETPDSVAAVAWLSIAAAGGNLDAEFRLGEIYKGGGSGVVQSLKLALACFLDAAAPWAGTSPRAQAEAALGDLYANDGKAEDQPTAQAWYTKAAADGDARSQDIVGQSFEPPAAKTPSYDRARDEFVKSAAQQDAAGETYLAELFRDHHIGTAPANAQCPAEDQRKLAPSTRGLKPDTQQALCWLTKAADQRFPQAEEDIGNLYCGNKIDVANKPVVVLAWFERAAGDGNADANRWLVGAATFGNVDAITWVEQAAADGDPVAKRWIAEHQHPHTTTAIPTACL